MKAEAPNPWIPGLGDGYGFCSSGGTQPAATGVPDDRAVIKIQQKIQQKIFEEESFSV